LDVSINEIKRKAQTYAREVEIFAVLACYSPVGLNAVFVKGVDNVMADFLSRNVYAFEHSETETFACFFASFPQMATSARFLPSHRLLLLVWQALSTGVVSHQALSRMTPQNGRDEYIFGRFVLILASATPA